VPLCIFAIVLGVYPQALFNYMSPSVDHTVDVLIEWQQRQDRATVAGEKQEAKKQEAKKQAASEPIPLRVQNQDTDALTGMPAGLQINEKWSAVGISLQGAMHRGRKPRRWDPLWETYLRGIDSNKPVVVNRGT